MGAERAMRRQTARPVTVWRNGSLVRPTRALEPAQRRLWVRLLSAWLRTERELLAAERRTERGPSLETDARDADLAAVQLRARRYGPSRGSGVRKDQIERLALKGAGE